jgi:hypothetical protein
MTWYIVIHESHLENSRGDTRTDYGVASSLYEKREHAENQLAYCEMMQRAGHPGSEGRYFMAIVGSLDEAEPTWVTTATGNIRAVFPEAI